MATICIDDRYIIKEIGQELEHILQVDGADCALSYLKYLLNTQYATSEIFLMELGKLKPVRKLLSELAPQEADVIRQSLYGTNSASQVLTSTKETVPSN